LIYDVLKQYEPDHILMQSNQMDAERELIGLHRLTEFLKRINNRISYRTLTRLSPFSIPIILEIGRETVHGRGQEELLRQESLAERAESLLLETIQKG
jgi:ATP-dependent Lhr-like helicase